MKYIVLDIIDFYVASMLNVLISSMIVVSDTKVHATQKQNGYYI